jgi:hypothetical protein
MLVSLTTGYTLLIVCQKKQLEKELSAYLTLSVLNQSGLSPTE